MSPSFLMIIPSLSPIALNTLNTSAIGAFVMSNGGISTLSVGTSVLTSVETSVSSPSGDISASTSISAPSSSSSTCGNAASASSPCSRTFFFFGVFKDSLTNSLISSFIVEASIPFAFSLIASSIVFICNNAFSTTESFVLKFIFFKMRI